jgi:beta-lactamase superfamily II metal-dependent hydrolase
LEKLAIENGIPIYEPFQGLAIGPFSVLSPEINWYVHELIPAFEKTPKQKAARSMATDAIGILTEAMRKAGAWIAENWNIELLREHVETSAENESSVVLFADFDGRGVLLTGDAGIQALNRAADYAELYGVHLPSRLEFVQVPHHGSRHNVSTSVLDRIIGARRLTNDGVFPKIALVSAGKESTTHPRKMVTNAFNRRGARPYATKGMPIHHRRGMPDRGWGAAPALEFSSQVEAWD